MADPVDTLREHLAVVAALGRRIPDSIAGIGAADDADVVALIPAAQALVNTATGILALAAGEVRARDGGRKDPSLAQRLGQRDPASLIAHRAGISHGQAHVLVDVGTVIRRDPATGEPERPHVAEALLAGDLSLNLARLISDTLDSITTLTPEETDGLEGALVEQATTGDLSVAAFTRDCKRLVPKHDPESAEDRDAALRAKASIRQTSLSNGLLRVVAELDPERAAYYLAAIAARTNPHRDHTHDDDAPDPSGVTAPRPGGVQPDPMVTRLDAFTSVFRDALAIDDGAQAGVSTTVLVRIDAKDLETGIGTATVDGIDTPVSAATARRMAANAAIIPQVYGGRSELLDQGHARRLFTRAQRYAIWARYDACPFPGCDLPLTMTQLHHIGRWAHRGRHGKGTDLTDGIPLCGFHNRLMETGWDVRIDPDGTPWFTPPPHLGPTPLRGTHHLHAA